MSDQISRELAMELALTLAKHVFHDMGLINEDCNASMAIWRAAGLIKPSKLDEARAWCRRVRVNENLPVSYREAVEDTEGYFEAAITEILEERE